MKKRRSYAPFNSRLSKAIAETPISVDEFLFAIQIRYAAIEHRLVIPHPARSGVVLEDEHADRQQICFADAPENRLALAIRQEFGNRMKSSVILARWLAWLRMDDDPRMEQWRQQRPDGLYVHDAVWIVAATEPLLPPCAHDFNGDTYFARVADVVAAEGTD